MVVPRELIPTHESFQYGAALSSERRFIILRYIGSKLNLRLRNKISWG